MSVFEMNHGGVPLMSCSEKRARKLLAAGRVHVSRLAHCVIQLFDHHAPLGTHCMVSNLAGKWRNPFDLTKEVY